jgi:hypothetical protein
MENKYEIQWRVETLAQISMVEETETASFSSNGISFSHWESPDLSGRESNYWIAKGCVESSGLNPAIVDFLPNLQS